MSLPADEGDDQMECVIRDLAKDMVSKKWVFGKWLSCGKACSNAFKVNDEDTAAMGRLRRALSRDPDALHALFDMFASAVCVESTDKQDSAKAALRSLSLSAVTNVHSFDALRARVDAATGGIPAPELIEHLLSKVDDGGDDGLNFRSSPFPNCVVGQNSFTFAMGPRCDDDDGGGQDDNGGGGGHGEGLLVYLPVISATGAYGALVRWPTPPEVGATEDLHAALAMARWMDSWGDGSLFGGGRYRSVLVCHARRSSFDSRLPYDIGPPRYLVVCAEQTRPKTARRVEQKPVNYNTWNLHSVHFALDLRWQPLALGACALVGGYMVYRYGVSVVWPSTYQWRTNVLRLCRPTVSF